MNWSKQMCKIGLFPERHRTRKGESVSACVIYWNWWSDLLAMNHLSALTFKALEKWITCRRVGSCYFSDKIMNKGFKWQHKTSLFPLFLFIYKMKRSYRVVGFQQWHFSTQMLLCWRLILLSVITKYPFECSCNSGGFDQFKRAKQSF